MTSSGRLNVFYEMTDEVIDINYQNLFLECESLERELKDAFIYESENDEKKESLFRRIVNAIKNMFQALKDKIKNFFSKNKSSGDEEVEMDGGAWDTSGTIIDTISSFLGLPINTVINMITKHKKIAIVGVLAASTVPALTVKEAAKNKKRKIKKEELKKRMDECDSLIQDALKRINELENEYKTAKDNKPVEPTAKKGFLGRVKEPTAAERLKYMVHTDVRNRRMKDAKEGINEQKKIIEKTKKEAIAYKKAHDAIPEETSKYLKICKKIVSLLRSIISNIMSLYNSGGGYDGDEVEDNKPDTNDSDNTNKEE